MTPTGVAIRDAREQLFSAAERILRRDGAQGLTSRAVTTEAGVAKGVLHRYFTDFDAFLTDLVLDRIARVEAETDALIASVGDGTVEDRLTEALIGLFSSVAPRIVSLITFRDELRFRLRAARPGPGVPLAGEAMQMVARYLAAEQALGRVAPEADVDTLALMLVGSGQLLSADGEVLTDEIRRLIRATLPR